MTRVEGIAAVMRDSFSEVVAGLTTGHVLVGSGQAMAAVPPLARAVDGARASKIHVLLPYAAAHLGLALSQAGQTADGVAVLEEVVAQSKALHFIAYLSRWTSMLGEAYSLAGRVDEAGTAGTTALDLARQYGERSNEAWAMRLLGNVASVRGHAVERGTYRAGASAIAAELQMRPLMMLLAGESATGKGSRQS